MRAGGASELGLQDVYDLNTANQIYETVLRNKANLVIPGTSTNPDERHIALAARRGLAIHHSHFEVVGFGPYMWLDGDAAPRNTYNWSQHPDLMAHTWKAAIDAQKDFEVVWTVGLRGLWDYTYCGKEAKARCGDEIASAMANQTGRCSPTPRSSPISGTKGFRCSRAASSRSRPGCGCSLQTPDRATSTAG